MPPKKRKGRRKKRTIDEAVASSIQSKLKAACTSDDPLKFFKRFDKDRSGSVDYDEFKKMIRVGLKITKEVLPDKDIEVLIKALDDDGGGTLDLEELADFVERGTATFNDGG
eukprot:CAMPEP_0119517948 /NCGR_PEP_ID=MMETSP1344-20130328/34706_1 /TAXON_ID=236787 /ORGANISM="Florenciella parvula, Strain CCMP2471" /LENGTH=111 /DNA_ID=CAMNT_0007555593 /DNA_START=90 /DNA_END=422 /DNA_ORIENTATION=-